MLTFRQVLEELIHPMRDIAILFALLGFWVLFTIAIYSGIFGLWLLAAIVPAFFQYLLVVVQARVNGKAAPAVDIELFSFAQRLWSLFPMVLVALSGLVVYLLAISGHVTLAVLAAALAFMLLPLSLAVLTITHSALECLRPTALWNMARGWGRHSVMVLGASLAGALLVYLGVTVGLPGPLLILCILYCLLLIASVGGHAMAIQDVPIEITIPDPVLPSEQEVREKTNKVRARTLSHAYGMVSRGNRAGGVHHILEDIQDSPDPMESFRWFFKEMLRWESPRAAALVGQQFISRLLAEGRDQEAIKIIVGCRHADPEFTLLEADRAAALRLARYIHDPDLKAWLLDK